MAKLIRTLLIVAVALVLLSEVAVSKKHKLKAKVKDVGKDKGAKRNIAHKADQIRRGKDETDEDEKGNSMKKLHKGKNDKHVRMQQKYQDIEVWGAQVNDIEVDGGTESKYVDKDKSGTADVVVEAKRIQSGKYVDDLGDDFPRINRGQLKKIVKNGKRRLRKECKNMKISQVTGKPIIYIDEENEEGTLAAYVCIFCEPNGAPSATQTFKKPCAIYDDEGEEILKYDDLRKGYEKTGTGPGGNELSGKYHYGTDKDKFTVNNVNGLCSMETENFKTFWWTVTYGAYPHKFACGVDQAGDPINGGHSPLNDAHYAAEKTFGMFSDWYSSKPFKYMPLQLRVHYYFPYFNAFYTTYSGIYSFSDGDYSSYPLATFDVVSHELGHGVMEYGANLAYYGESGGLNEAFSDMTAMAVSEYAREKVTWRIGDVFKGVDKPPLRQMDMPGNDGKSIDHIGKYYAGMDVHYSSGLFNKLFYLMSESFAYGVWDAYDVMYYAMMNYWSQTSTFAEAAEGCLSTIDGLKDGSVETPYTYSWLDTDQMTKVLGKIGIKCGKDSLGWICTK